MAIMRGADVKRMERILSHSEARAAGLLLDVTFSTEIVRETTMFGMGGSLDKRKHITLTCVGDMVLNPLRKILYVAHRWQAHTIHDPAQQELLMLVQSIVSDLDFVWMDFWSVPNESFDPAKAAAIHSMQAYVFRATAVLVIAVSEEDLRLFMNRCWCQAELYAALCPVLAVRDFACVGSGSGDRSSYTNVYKHACGIQIFVQGQTPFGLDLGSLRNPMRCGISSNDDLLLLKPSLERVRDACRAARPTEATATDRYDSSEEIVTGIEDETIDLMLMGLGF
mmetsp:Transcript_90239/g.159802  ORF Transcript_90239/g.159802 Transcript_90239/m.159802 type:complete len:281 (-) Transcript_90239:33-875(-)